MSRRAARLEDAYDPVAARWWRWIAFTAAVVGAVTFGLSIGLIIAEKLNTDSWGIPGLATVMALVGFVAGVVTVLSAWACIAAVAGPTVEDEAEAFRKRVLTYQAPPQYHRGP